MISTRFNPSFIERPGFGAFYEDGRVTAAIDQDVHETGKMLVIHEFSSRETRMGHAREALQWIRQQGFTVIVANGVGLIESGVCDISTSFWLHMHAEGLVDILLDDLGDDVTPERASENREAHSASYTPSHDGALQEEGMNNISCPLLA